MSSASVLTMPEDQTKPSRDIGKPLPTEDERRAAAEAAAKAEEAVRAAAAVQPEADSPESAPPVETEVQRLKRENVNVDQKPEEATVKVQLADGYTDVNWISAAGKDYDFRTDKVQTVTPSEAALLNELDSVEVVA